MVSSPPHAKKCYRACVSYDGTEFHGFAENPGVETVAGKIRESLEMILGNRIDITCAGRTDAGVHAEGQIISFDAEDFDYRRVQKSLNKLCAPYISIRDLQEAEDFFNARFSAVSRTYRYRILNQEYPDPFSHRFSWHVSAQIDLRRVEQATQALIGEHDFSSFCRKATVLVDGKEENASLVREVLSINIKSEEPYIEIWITATSFCHQMVRSIVGTLVEIGKGRLKESDMASIILKKDRNFAGQVAPPQGLSLMKVGY
ncbi:MAG: tRNA pseudouridine(38-40) synthase TruA [Acidimicrobiaceae bacterium]|jgi:tRNA pseudouridine38-40 synthase|nr:tRNA pseudouridine(38-40) synthase TruA [Acidimicrobiaceae bacterium]|tara:strand:- start:52732 stop:53508 length:777 start_codon:yes stop_codon:yes gene_type:complete